MGLFCSKEDPEVYNSRMFELEEELYLPICPDGTSAPSSVLTREFLTIEMSGKPFKVWCTYSKEGPSASKKTVVMTHGYMGASTNFSCILPQLLETYHVVLFDNTCWGRNTRLASEDTPDEEHAE